LTSIGLGDRLKQGVLFFRGRVECLRVVMNYDRHDGALMQRLALKDDLPSNDLAGGHSHALILHPEAAGMP